MALARMGHAMEMQALNTRLGVLDSRDPRTMEMMVWLATGWFKARIWGYLGDRKSTRLNSSHWE